jgi:hypothetical protein
MNDKALETLRIMFASALFVCVLLGAFGMKDSHQAKLPLMAIGAIIGWAYCFSK